MGLKDEILEQPEAIARLLSAGRRQVEAIARAVRARHPRFAVLAARGSSDHAGLYAQYLLGAHCRLPVALATPSVLTVYDRVPRYEDALVLGISQSGQSPDIVRVLEEAGREGALTLAITNERDSPLAAAAQYLIELRAGPERSVAATKTYTNQLVGVAMLSLALRGDGRDGGELARVPASVEAALSVDGAAEEAAARHRDIDRCVVIGRGYDYPTAREWSLKLQELARVLAHGFSAADFEHGPMALAGPDLTVLGVAASHAPRTAVVDLLRRLRTAGCDVLTVGSPDIGRRAGALLPVSDDLPDWLMPVVSIVPGQLYAYHLTRARGLDPDAPVGIQKVTLTT